MRREWTNDEVKYLIDNYGKIPNTQIAKDLGRTAPSINHKRKRLKLPPFRIRYDVNQDFFKKWTKEMAYILGYWFADGSIWISNGSYKFNITSNDVEHLERIRDIMESNNPIYDREDDDSHEFRISNKVIYNDILRLGGVPRKSSIARFPKVPNEYVIDFIRGYFDGDGGISLRENTNEPSISFTSTKQFIDKLEKHLTFKGRKYQLGDNTYEIFYDGEYAQYVLKYLYENAGLYLERKYKLYEEGMKWKRQRKIRCDSMLYKINNEVLPSI